ncbi:MAG: response regulator [Chloroflexi bacterium]|nr:response regulator [Chloroflexota bacterium]
MDKPVFLYVEDDAYSREIMSLILGDMLGYSNVTVFENSTDFVARLEKLTLKPEVIFLDIHMLPHNGFEMLSMIRQHPDYSGVKVIALTASVMNEEVNRLREAGFDSCLAKPLDQRSFPDVLARILAGEHIWRIK